jgi:hypothetical protein
MPQLSVKSGSKDKEVLAPMLSYIRTVADHAWVVARLKQLNPGLQAAQSRWGLDIAQMLTGSESMFNRYLSERNLNKLVGVLKVAEDADSFRSSVMDRLATLTAQILASEKEEQRKTYLAIQIANVRLLNQDVAEPYTHALQQHEVGNLREALPLAEKLYTELDTSPIANPQPLRTKAGDGEPSVVMDYGQFVKALESGLKALGMANSFEIKG